MTGQSPSALRRLLRQRAFVAVLVALGVVAFAYPLLRLPALTPAQSYLFLFCAWGLFVAVLYGLSRALAGGEPETSLGEDAEPGRRSDR